MNLITAIFQENYHVYLFHLYIVSFGKSKMYSLTILWKKSEEGGVCLGMIYDQ